MSLNFWKRCLRSLHKSQPREYRQVPQLSRCRPRLEVLEDRCVPATITVTGIGDSIAVDGLVTLREALTSANNNANVNADVVGVGAYGFDTIKFNIAGAGVHTITPASPLPTITDALLIDGYTQPGASANTLAVGDNAVLLIELNGMNVVGNVNIPGDGSGLNITGGGSTIRGLVINRFRSGDGGIRLASDNNVVEGNFIGLDPAGTSKLVGNYPAGVRVVTGANNLIGGTTPAARNVISANGNVNNSSGYNVLVNTYVNFGIIDPAPPSGTLIRGNYIGTNAAGTGALFTEFEDGNCNGIGVFVSTGTIIGGTDADDGVVDGNVGARNLISGNIDGIRTDEIGVDYAADLTVQGNFIGVDATGTLALPNYIFGITFAPERNRRSDNHITVGGTAAGAGNVISANLSGGVSITNSNVLMQGNRIGTDLAGILDLGNGFDGVFMGIGGSPPFGPVQFTVGGATAAARNIISGNDRCGLRISNLTTGATTVQGNYIGVQGDGISPLGNGSDGILAQESTAIGGTGAGEGNVIAFNGGRGVNIRAGTSPVLGNSIFANTALGIDLNNDGATANDDKDSDTGPNNLQNFPVITSVINGGNSITIAGTFNSTPSMSGFRLEFFASAASDSSGSGRRFLGFTNVDTDSNGNAAFSVTLSVTVPGGQVITATATDSTGNTSEFSAIMTVPQSGPPDLQISVSDSVTVANAGNVLTYTLNYSNTGGQSATGVQLTELLPAGTTFNAGASTAGWTETAPGSGIFKLNLGAVAAGGSGSAVFAVTVNNPVPPGQTQIVNTASIADDGEHGADPTPTNNTSTDTDAIAGPPDLRISVSDSVTSAASGNTLVYTLSYTNTGGQDATGVQLTELLPAGTSFNAGASTAGWTETAPGSGIFKLNLGAVAAGGSGSAVFAVTVNNPVPPGQTQIVNTASIADDGEHGADPTPANNTSTDTDALAGPPDLRISLTDGVTSTSAGSTLTYTLNYSNTGGQSATGVQLTELLPTGTTFNAGASTAGWTETAPGSGIFKLNLGSVAAGASGSAVFVVTVNNPVPPGQTQIVNSASITDDGVHGADPTPANNTSTDTDALSSPATADVAVALVASSATIHPGENLTLTITVRNLGNTTATGVTLSDLLPDGVTFVSFTVPSGWTKHAPSMGGTGTVTATRPSLAAGAVATLKLVVRVSAGAADGTMIANEAQVATTSADSNPSNNTASATVQVVQQTAIRTTFTLVSRSADYRSELGLFIVDDATGRIGSLNPGDPGYAQAALSRRQFAFGRFDALGTSHTLDLPVGSFFGWYLVQNNTSARFLATNPNNRLNHGPLMFFSFKAANPDAAVHTQQLTATQIGFEDLTYGGDRDFNDLIVDVRSRGVPHAHS